MCRDRADRSNRQRHRCQRMLDYAKGIYPEAIYEVSEVAFRVVASAEVIPQAHGIAKPPVDVLLAK